MTTTPELAALLKRIRTRASMSQADLSVKAGLSETYYGKIEGESRRPSGDALNALLDALPCTPAERIEAIRLLATSLFPPALLSEWQERPGALIAPRKRPDESQRRKIGRIRIRRALGVLIAVSSIGWGAAEASPYPLALGATGSLLSDVLRRWLTIPRPCHA